MISYSIIKSITFLVIVLTSVCTGQRVAPGVPPQHYQQVPGQHPPQQQHFQQPPPQQQQMHVAPGVAPQHYQQPQQYQQVPVQQQQYQQPPPQQQHHVPQGQPIHQQPQQKPQPHHGHHQAHGQPQQVLNTGNIQQEREHIQEHMQVPIDTSKMSESELQFHYFKMHDSDNNNKLDGCELIKSLIHWHADDAEKGNGVGEEGTGTKSGTIYTDQNLADIIDYVLKTMDLNKDGYVDYTEYRKSEDLDKKP